MSEALLNGSSIKAKKTYQLIKAKINKNIGENKFMYRVK